MIPELQKLFDSLLKVSSNLPGFANGYALRVGLSLVLLGLSIVTLVKSKRDGYRAMNGAIERLKAYIRSRSKRPELLSAGSLRTLAASIQKQMGCPPLTDGAIAEAIRTVALELEDLHSGDALERRLKLLDEPLKELDPDGGKLLSLATVDRMVAYFMTAAFGLRRIALSQLAIECVVLAVYLIPWHLHPLISRAASYPLLLLWIYPTLYLRHAFMAVRAGTYWRDVSHEGVKEQKAFRTRRRFSSIRLNPRLDRYAYPIQSTDLEYLETDWGPRAEAKLVLRSGFVEAHQYKHFEVINLERKLLRYQEYLPILDADLVKESLGAKRCAEICRRLWILTGRPAYLPGARASTLAYANVERQSV